ncbi:hypothetical protein [Streptacidiphilus carbonis]|uniref:hypothetical protein n=1 Tax=Streptacidiphilus carbonis TaxID=105422 RepID=UPI0005AA86A6|nr:hypothetical protein [Streptacidiphilus carbonis]
MTIIARITSPSGTSPRRDRLAGRNFLEGPALTPADLPMVLGLLAEQLRDTPDIQVREASHGGRIVRRGQGRTVRIAAGGAVRQAVLGQCAALAAVGTGTAGRKAYRAYADRIISAAQAC